MPGHELGMGFPPAVTSRAINQFVKTQIRGWGFSTAVFNTGGLYSTPSGSGILGMYWLLLCNPFGIKINHLPV